MLVGVPGSGKSTWAANQEWVKDCAYISTDQYIEEYAKSVGKTYSEVFEEYMPKAVHIMTQNVIQAREEGKDIIWDQTSTGKKVRAKKFRMLPTYEAIAVVFPIPEPKELERRLASRPGKNIPDHVMKQMIENFSMPTKSEGFTEIRIIKQ